MIKKFKAGLALEKMGQGKYYCWQWQPKDKQGGGDLAWLKPVLFPVWEKM